MGPSYDSSRNSGFAEAQKRLRSPASHPLAYPLVLLFDVLAHMCQSGELPDAAMIDSFNSSSLQLDETIMKVPQNRQHGGDDGKSGDTNDDNNKNNTDNADDASSFWNFHELQNFVLLKSGDGRLNFWQAAQDAHGRRVALQQDLQNDAKNWLENENGRETMLTKSINDTVQARFETRHVSVVQLTSKGEVFVKGKDNVVNEGDSETSGRIDVALIEKNKELLALLEFGKENDDMWWKKMDQARKYYDIISGKEQNRVKASESMPSLLTVVTYDSERISFRLSAFLMWWFEPEDDEKQDVMVNLWNYKGLVKDDLAKSLAILCSVAETLYTWRSMSLEQDVYEVLGPSCTRVKWQHPQREDEILYKVLRFYDSRLRRTLRSPALYLNPAAGLHGIPLSFGATGAAEDRALFVLAVPYWEGDHVTRKPADFLAIYHELKRLHASGIVHGDIRCFNIVFSNLGKFIDFDFGGVWPNAKYPDQYNNYLVDGRRAGKKCGNIEKWHDWFAFGYVIFVCHFLDEPIDPEGSRTKEFHDFGGKWNRCGKKFLRLHSETGLDALVQELGDLLEYLERDGGWTCEPAKALADIVAENGETATGSPKVQKGKKRTAAAAAGETYDY